MHFVEVAIKVPLPRTFDYKVEPLLHNTELQPGMRVLVPFGPQKKVAVILATKTSTDIPKEKIKAIIEVIDEAPILSKRHLELLKFTARYYCYPLGETIHTALPAALRQGECPDKTSINMVELTEKGAKLPSLRAKTQLNLLKQLAQSGKSSLTELKALGFNKKTIDSLLEKALIKQFIEHDNQWQQHAPTVGKKPTLNKEQAVACTTINQAHGFASFLLEGVTGSGKTEVYLQCLEEVLKKGQQALVLVPEIGLTPQTVNRFRRRFPDTPIMLWHSALTDNERLQTWRFCEKGSCAIVIGTRSSIFLPFSSLGMIIVDEEHDSSFKQQDTLRYHARDLAAYRAFQHNIPLVLGSATPALETLHKAITNKYQLLSLTQRAQTSTDNQFQLLDMKGQPEQAGIAHASLAYMRQHLERGKQVMVFLNRRGFSPTLICHECGWLSECSRCSTSATFHKAIGQMICHHCGEQHSVPHQCPDCGSTQIFPNGKGTEQIEEFLTQTFPDIPISRIDRDSTRRKGSLEKALDDINQGGARILVGTQMLAKGHHFADVSLVLILDVDSGLYSCDFRATEHLAQLVTQVAGRAGRSGEPGQVLLQTHFPEHPLLQDLVNNGYHDFARYALTEREDAQLPPITNMAIVRAEGHNINQVMDFLTDLVPVQSVSGIQLLGPIPAPLERVAGKYRFQLHIQAQERSHLHQYLAQMVDYISTSKLAQKVRWSLDVDPIDMI
ncbi:primosomal protein N' [Pseudoalteromonas sp. N1230-9]|jgi:primosomal protein N' (replication factor Y)|uniref:primosomal protein N' n=1 Tax=unclassified Pseudoalteromonas TaxID=194690 RepID=UPI001022F29C|nr:primosomal protein N' [Pseudoalteromonas sp. CO302Y]RZG07114.1 primosomal protein N' [Pseudoalteromonas sp. CO133X]WOC26689.1 primosomal protein N' [Pseudoalteromonas sp. N1230-9]